MNIAVCDDIRENRVLLCNYIQSYCEQHCYKCNISVFDAAEALLAAFTPGAFNLLFLDIFLPGISGVDAARKIRETDRDCMLVFITDSPDFTMDGFLVQAAGYVVKPINRTKMEGAMHACRFEFEKSSRAIEIPQSGGNLLVSITDLVYVEVYDKESIFHMKRGKVVTRIPLETVEARLGGSPFLRCHRSYIVNMNYVEDMRSESFLMENGHTVPIRKSGRREAKMAMANFIAKSPMEVK